MFKVKIGAYDGQYRDWADSHVAVQRRLIESTAAVGNRRRWTVFVYTVNCSYCPLLTGCFRRGRDKNLTGNVMAGCGNECGSDLEHANRHERRILIIVLLINAAMFVAEFSAGLVSGSTALLADSLDMLADALIYALGLYALGRAKYWRARAALTSGIFQLLLGLGIATEAIWKTFADSLPDAATMGLFGAIALVANTACFFLLARFRDGDINLRATWICSRNDMISNVGVLLAATLVAWSNSPLPDIAIGLIIAVVVVHSAWRIVIEAKKQLQTKSATGENQGQ
jgi:Co/Zn/Cd efflux system component